MSSYKQDHVHVTTQDPRKAVQFYTKIMGARVIKEVNNNDRLIIDLDLGGIPLRISSSTGADDNWKGLRLGLHHLALFVDDMDKAAAEMKSTGVDFVVKPHSSQPGLKAAFIRTPEGVLIELTEKN